MRSYFHSGKGYFFSVQPIILTVTLDNFVLVQQAVILLFQDLGSPMSFKYQKLPDSTSQMKSSNNVVKELGRIEQSKLN